jgi:hypothetical protein
MAGPVGMAVAPLAMFGLAEQHGWRAGFLGLAVVCALCAVAAHVLRARGWVLDALPVPETVADDQVVLQPRTLMLVAVVGINAFLLDGFTAAFPETIARHGVFVWDLETVLFAVLGIGALGQFVGGLLARGSRDVRMYVWIVAAQAPLLLLVAGRLSEPVAPFGLLSAFAFVNFMTQPVENSLLAGFTARGRRGTVYALKFLVGLVMGSPAAVVAMGLAERRGFPQAWTLLGVVGLLAIVLVLLFARRVRAVGRAVV